MRPNDFILNSNYLPLAQTNKVTLTANFSSQVLQEGEDHFFMQDFTVPSNPGSIDNFLISVNNDDYFLGSYVILTEDEWLNIFRVTSTKMRVQLLSFRTGSGEYTLPAYIIKIKMVSFKPPNVF